ncbi:MAG: type II toxin-antitoxin system PemK/MazF family toxin [Deltaproteobacteria bacterium]|nr:type II toxin-antitoxin system PemK/MazF family toxin [Deltaproteobacteria bacterium]
MTKDFKQYTVVSIPFPFTDKSETKHRPALILSSAVEFNKKIGHSVMAMITSAKNSPWPLDVEISDLKCTGLPAPSIIRMKLFTMDHRLITKHMGVLSKIDQIKVNQSLSKLIPLRSIT